MKGITYDFEPENSDIINFISKKTGFKTSLPGIRFSSVEKNKMSALPVPKSRLLT
jgi:hypothetical protein